MEMCTELLLEVGDSDGDVVGAVHNSLVPQQSMDYGESICSTNDATFSTPPATTDAALVHIQDSSAAVDPVVTV
jgi:hypothetical protein